jgi:pimeloyl-ACP methyl ester carboxylesterase
LSDIAECWVAPLPPWDDLPTIADAILESAPAQFALAGWSMGGYVALEIMRKAPERVLRLALLSTSAEPERPEIKRRRRMMLQLVEKAGFIPAISSFGPRFLLPENRSGELAKNLIKQAYEVGSETFRIHQLAMMKRAGYGDVLPRIKCPALVIGGRQDIVTPPEAHSDLARSIPGAKLVLVDQAAHMITLEQPEAVNRSLRHWLRREIRTIAA